MQTIFELDDVRGLSPSDIFAEAGLGRPEGAELSLWLVAPDDQPHPRRAGVFGDDIPPAELRPVVALSWAEHTGRGNYRFLPYSEPNGEKLEVLYWHPIHGGEFGDWHRPVSVPNGEEFGWDYPANPPATDVGKIITLKVRDLECGPYTLRYAYYGWSQQWVHAVTWKCREALVV
jgi:hypothetical protein